MAAVIDLAELPTHQERAAVTVEGSARYNARICEQLARDLTVRLNGRRLMWTVRPTGFEYQPGSAGLHTTRVTCALSAAADLAAASTVDVTNGYRADRIGWRELTATGHGVHPVDPPIPARSVTDLLRLPNRPARLAARSTFCSAAGRSGRRTCSPRPEDPPATRRSGQPLDRERRPHPGTARRRPPHPAGRRARGRSGARARRRARRAPRTRQDRNGGLPRRPARHRRAVPRLLAGCATGLAARPNRGEVVRPPVRYSKPRVRPSRVRCRRASAEPANSGHAQAENEPGRLS